MHYANILVGPTAVGKTEAAHILAVRSSAKILSADSMLVYKGMDVGTAKPDREDLKRFGYGGVDIVGSESDFNLAHYIEHARSVVEALTDAPLIVVGGTGLYVKALTRGLDDAGRPNPELRSAAEAVYDRGGLEALQTFVARRAPESYGNLKDRDNPRRLIRALEVSSEVQPSWHEREPQRLVGLWMDRGLLADRIAARVDRMYAAGLLDEVAGLLREDRLSRTARQAIGYREAIAVLAGDMEWSDARERICTRTRRLAKSQMTWFRNQERVDWIDAGSFETAAAVADRVEEQWRENGRNQLRF